MGYSDEWGGREFGAAGGKVAGGLLQSGMRLRIGFGGEKKGEIRN